MKWHFADGAGVLGAVFAALCCAGNSLIIGGLAAVGLTFLRRDAILWPAMLVSLAIALWGFWKAWKFHRQLSPGVLGATGAVSLAAGVIVVHGGPAMQMIYGGAMALTVAAVLNMRARRRFQALQTHG